MRPTVVLVTGAAGEMGQALIARLADEYAIPEVYHLAAVLSTRAEFAPEAAHRVNVDGTMGLLRLAVEQSQSIGRPVIRRRYA